MPTALIVDDDPLVQALITFKLERAGFTVLQEADGEAGLAAAITHRPDVILLDWFMPRLSGVDTCRAIRRTAGMGSVPVILLSANADRAHVEVGLAAGADDYIVKPFSPRKLVGQVQAVMARAG
jgi:two-component system, OmpR family, phosphate regulon response regulator PhoB